MLPSFIAFLNKSGVACAADTDGTVFKLAKNEPFAVAVNPHSPIPWEKIINGYKLRGEPQPQVLFTDYVHDFEQFLQGIPAEDSWESLGPEDAKVVFMGYGSEDLYPSAVDCMVRLGGDGYLCFDEEVEHVQIDNHDKFTYNILGDFESVATLLWGSTRKTREFLLGKYAEVYHAYRERALDRFKGTEDESAIRQHLDAFDVEAYVGDAMSGATGRVFNDMRIGIDSFCVQDMVDAVETLVNANVKLNCLRSGIDNSGTGAREIGVITRPEGFTWLKHGIFTQ